MTRALLVCAALLLSVSTAMAQMPSGTLRVRVPSRPGVAVTVVVTDTSDATRQRRAVVDADGVALFVALAPATYDVAVDIAGRTVASGPVDVESHWITTADVVAPATTTAHVRAVDRQRSGEGTDFNARLLRDLPGAHDVWALVETAAPFVVVDRMDTGGIGVGASALAGGRGESWALTEVTVDGVATRLPTRAGRLPVVIDMNAASAIGVSSGLASAARETPGVVIDVVATRPGDEWHGGLDVSATTPGMVGVNRLPHAPSVSRVDTWRNAAAFGGGRITPRAGVFVSAADTRLRYFERDVADRLSSSSSGALVHLLASPGSRNQLRLLATGDRVAYPFDGRAQLADRDVDETGTFARTQAAWDHVTTGGTMRSVVVGYQRGAWRPDVATGAGGGVMDRVLDGVVPAPPSDVTHTQWDGRVTVEKASRVLGVSGHAYGGVTVRRSTASTDVVVLPAVAELVAGVPARIWNPVAPASRSFRALNEFGVFAGDRLMFGPTVTADLGVRFDIVRGAARGASSDLRWNTVSPRLSVRWKPSRLSLFAGVGRYVGAHGTSFLTFGDPGETTWDVHRWVDANDNQHFDTGEQGGLVSRAGRGAGVATLDPELRAPRTTEWSAGAEYQVASHSTIRGAIVLRRQTDVKGVMNPGVPASDYRLYLVPDINADEGSAADDQLLPIYERLPRSFGNDALVLTNPETDAIAHDGIEVGYEFRTNRWFMVFGAMTYRTLGWGGALGYNADENDQLVPGDRFWNPNALKDSYGRLFFDRAYVGKWTVGFRGPGDVRYAAVARYQDGQPFTRYVVAPDLAGGPEIVQAYSVGRTRFTYTGTIDLRVEKGVAVRGRRLSIRIDAFNITNHANEVEEDVMSGAGFRLSTAVQPPRTLRFGLRFEF